MTAYIALVHKDRDSDLGITFPDFPGCVTAGRDMDEARRMATEALALHIEGMVADDDPVPAPSSMESVLQDAENRPAVTMLVDVAVPELPEMVQSR